MKVGDVMVHNYLGTVIDITAIKGNWVEFLERKDWTLRYLEEDVVAGAYKLVRNSPVLAEAYDVDQLRAQARAQGIMVPREFNNASQSQ